MSKAIQLPLPLPEVKETIRRRVCRVGLQPKPDGSYLFKSKSFTRRLGVAYRCRVNPVTNQVWCSCRDFKYRKSRWQPTFTSGPYCKHLTRAVRTVRKLKKGKIQLAA